MMYFLGIYVKWLNGRTIDCSVAAMATASPVTIIRNIVYMMHKT